MRRALAPVLVLGACVFGWRGEAPIDGSHDLAGVRTVHVDLPSTPLAVLACDPDALPGCPERLRWRGRVLATGGSAADAERHARQLALVFEATDGLGLLRADIPLAIRGLVELELEAIELPSDRDLELATDRGDVEVVGARGSVAVTSEVGDVHVEGGDGGVAVLAGLGDVVLETAGDVEVDVDVGGVTVVQTGEPRRVHVTTGDGAVRLELASASDLDLDVRAEGEIRVVTDAIVALAEDRLVRQSGAGTIAVVVDAGGPVDVVLRE